MVTNLFETYVRLEHGDSISDVIDIYGNLFDKLSIYLDEYEDEFAHIDFDDEDDLQILFKTILLKEAQNNGIIPDYWDINDDFYIDGDFAIIQTEEDDEQLIQDTITNFKDWSDIELNIIKD